MPTGILSISSNINNDRPQMLTFPFTHCRNWSCTWYTVFTDLKITISILHHIQETCICNAFNRCKCYTFSLCWLRSSLLWQVHQMPLRNDEFPTGSCSLETHLWFLWIHQNYAGFLLLILGTMFSRLLPMSIMWTDWRCNPANESLVESRGEREKFICHKNKSKQYEYSCKLKEF